MTDELEYLRDLDDEQLLGHVQAQHLIAYAEGRIDDPAATFVRDHVGGCDVCREAMEVYRSTMQVERGEGLWDFLRRTILAPAPALVYLIVLAVGISVWWIGPGTTVGPDPVPVTARLYPDDTLRGEDVAVDPVPVAWSDGRAVVLLVHTDIAPGDIAGSLALRVETEADRIIVEESVATAELSEDGVLSVIVPATDIRVGAVYRVRVEAEGVLPFSATFRIEE